MKKHTKTQCSNRSDKEYTSILVCRDHAVIEFNGILLTKPVLWHAEIRTLTYHCVLNSITSGTIRQFICIPPQELSDEQQTAKIILGLNIPLITDSVLTSSLILIRQYKNLKPGLHSYGDSIEIQGDRNKI